MPPRRTTTVAPRTRSRNVSSSPVAPTFPSRSGLPPSPLSPPIDPLVAGPIPDTPAEFSIPEGIKKIVRAHSKEFPFLRQYCMVRNGPALERPPPSFPPSVYIELEAVQFFLSGGTLSKDQKAKAHQWLVHFGCWDWHYSVPLTPRQTPPPEHGTTVAPAVINDIADEGPHGVWEDLPGTGTPSDEADDIRPAAFAMGDELLGDSFNDDLTEAADPNAQFEDVTTIEPGVSAPTDLVDRAVQTVDATAGVATVSATPPAAGTLEALFAGFEQRLNAKIDGVEQRLNAKIDGVEERLTAVEERLTAVEERLTAVEERLTAVEERLTAVEERLTAVEKNMEQEAAMRDQRAWNAARHSLGKPLLPVIWPNAAPVADLAPIKSEQDVSNLSEQDARAYLAAGGIRIPDGAHVDVIRKRLAAEMGLPTMFADIKYECKYGYAD